MNRVMGEPWQPPGYFTAKADGALRLIAQMRLRQNRLDEAFQAQRRAVARQPDEPRQYVLLSDILEKMGRTAEARSVLAKASQLRALVADTSVAN